MKMKTFTFFALLFFTCPLFSQVDNAVLELESNDKGLLLPRLADTSSVANPTSGLMIYDQNTQSPAFHNGTNWNTMASAMSMASTFIGDSITYKIGGPGSSIYDTGTFEVLAISFGASYFGAGANPSFQDVSFTKWKDNNSIPFLRALAGGTVVADIEFMIYEKGASSPYYSIKYSTWFTSSVSGGTSAGGRKTENVTVSANRIGFRDWITNDGFSYDLTTNTIGSY